MVARGLPPLLPARLDACYYAIKRWRGFDLSGLAPEMVPPLGDMQRDAILYSAFLTDLGEGRIDGSDATAQYLVGLVEDFCASVERELLSDGASQ